MYQEWARYVLIDHFLCNNMPFESSSKKLNMKMHPGQYEIIKDLLIQPVIEDIANICVNNPLKCQSIIWHLLIGQTDYACSLMKIDKESGTYNSILSISRLFAGEIDLKTTFALMTPNLQTLRLAILNAIVECMNEEYQENYAKHFPLLNTLDEKMQGMDRIRQLFQQYMSSTNPGSIERYKLAFEILLIKEQLGLPSYLSSQENICKCLGYAPGDFSHLDLSGLDLSRKDTNHGNFKGLVIKKSNCDKTIWHGVCLWGADFTEASLRGSDLSGVYNIEDIVLSGADIEGAYLKNGYIPDRRAINCNKISLNKTQPHHFSNRHISAESLSNVAKMDQKALENFKLQFKTLFDQLQLKLNELQIKGEKNSKYKHVADQAAKLGAALNKASQTFFSSPKPTQQSLSKFKGACRRAISEARDEFHKHRDFFYQIHPILRGILGIIATLTFIPALVVKVISTEGYFMTFFSRPRTDSAKQLQYFEDHLLGQQGVFNTMNR